MKILFVVPYPKGEAPSQRFRFEHYLPYLDKEGIQYDYSSFWDNNTWQILYLPGLKWRKALGFLKNFTRRFFLLFSVWKYDFIFLHREATPLGPAWFEWTASHIFRKKIIFDFDDAIWIPAVSQNNKGIAWLRNFGKVARICKWSYKICPGNEYLADYSRKFNRKVIVLPTVVDTVDQHADIQDQTTTQPNIGWTGTFSTLKYLDQVVPVILELNKQYQFEFVVIADKDPELPLPNYRFIQWNRETEIPDLLTFHIGLMPLVDDELSKGKCGFKAIQYMSLGIPAVVSPVGVNTKIVRNKENGFVCNSNKEWFDSLSALLKDATLRRQMGQASRKWIEENYSVNSSVKIFLGLFE